MLTGHPGRDDYSIDKETAEPLGKKFYPAGFPWAGNYDTILIEYNWQ